MIAAIWDNSSDINSAISENKNISNSGDNNSNDMTHSYNSTVMKLMGSVTIRIIQQYSDANVFHSLYSMYYY